MPGAKERHETPTGEPSLGDITQIPRLLRAIFRLVEAHRNEIEGNQPRLEPVVLVARFMGPSLG